MYYFIVNPASGSGRGRTVWNTVRTELDRNNILYKVLDVILTTKSQQCQKRGIILQAMIDGTALSGIHVKDICSLFGNILDNAIEATQQVPCADKRLINLSVRRQKEFIIIECSLRQ